MNGESEVYTQTFSDVVLNGGFVGIIIWVFVLAATIAGPVLGIASVICSFTTKSKQMPLPFKLLVIGAIALFLTGLMGMLNGAMDSFFCLASSSGAEKAQVLSLATSQALYSFAFAVQCSFIYLFFITFSLIVLHFRQKNMYMQAANGAGKVAGTIEE